MKKQNVSTTQSPPLEESAGTNNSVQPPATAGGSDLEQLQTENEQLKATIRLAAAHRQITGELAKAGARSPELLFNAVKADLQFSADGEIENAAALVQKLRDAHPEQFGTHAPVPSIDAGAGRSAAPQLTRDALRAMKPAEIAALDWNEVKRVLAAG